MNKYTYIDLENKIITYKMIKIGGSWFCRVPSQLITESGYSSYHILHSEQNKSDIIVLK